MNPDLALIVVILIIAVIYWLARPGTWRRCRCGTEYCNGCNAKRGK